MQATQVTQQSNTGIETENQESETQNVDVQQVHSMAIYRSFSSPRLANVVALDVERNPLFVVASDVEFEDASTIVESFNQ